MGNRSCVAAGKWGSPEVPAHAHCEPLGSVEAPGGLCWPRRAAVALKYFGTAYEQQLLPCRVVSQVRPPAGRAAGPPARLTRIYGQCPILPRDDMEVSTPTPYQAPRFAYDTWQARPCSRSTTGSSAYLNYACTPERRFAPICNSGGPSNVLACDCDVGRQQGRGRTTYGKTSTCICLLDRIGHRDRYNFFVMCCCTSNIGAP
jgi:hypothetical protein